MAGLAVRTVALLPTLQVALAGCGEDSGEGDTASDDPVITVNEAAALNNYEDIEVTTEVR